MPSGPAANRHDSPVDMLTKLLGVPLSAAGFDLETVSVRRAGKQSVVAIAVDKDGGVDLDAVAQASQLVSDVLDRDDVQLPAALGASYTLEVTSRGTDAPLTLPRHWRRATGRLVQVHRRDGVALVGRLCAVDDTSAVLELSPAVDKSGKPGKKRVRKDGGAAIDDVNVAFADVATAHVVLEFHPVGAADLLDDVDLDVDADFDRDNGPER